MDARLRERLRRGEATARDLARAGLARVVEWDGRGHSDGHGHAYGDVFGGGAGYGAGYVAGTGAGYGTGHGDGAGNGTGNGGGYGRGDVCGAGYDEDEDDADTGEVGR